MSGPRNFMIVSPWLAMDASPEEIEKAMGLCVDLLRAKHADKPIALWRFKTRYASFPYFENAMRFELTFKAT